MVKITVIAQDFLARGNISGGNILAATRFGVWHSLDIVERHIVVFVAVCCGISIFTVGAERLAIVIGRTTTMVHQTRFIQIQSHHIDGFSCCFIDSPFHDIGPFVECHCVLVIRQHIAKGEPFLRRVKNAVPRHVPNSSALGNGLRRENTAPPSIVTNLKRYAGARHIALVFFVFCSHHESSHHASNNLFIMVLQTILFVGGIVILELKVSSTHLGKIVGAWNILGIALLLLFCLVIIVIVLARRWSARTCLRGGRLQ
mmetsp:Transcript_4365/g.12005  ORF Transcript_4365/g.12005 Transcript_4365/m.12005 type:complete len:258 (+) Transcript_4365:1999-2772(+)